MGIVLGLFVVGTVAAVVTTVAMGLYCWRQSVPGATAVGVTTVAGGAWSGTYLLSVLAMGPGWTFLWYRVSFVWSAVSTVAWVGFVAVYTDREWLASAGSLGLVALPAVASLAVVWTDGAPPFGGGHSLWWADAATVRVGAALAPSPSPGPVWIAYRVYLVAVFLGSGGLLGAYALSPGQRLYRRQNAIVLAAAFFPVGVSVVARAAEMALNPTPIAIAVAVVGVMVAVFGLGVDYFDSAPVARSSVVEAIDGGVLVYDDDHTVVDVNRLASRVLGVDDDGVGRSVEAVLAEEGFDELVELVSGPDPTPDGGGPADHSPNEGAGPAATGERVEDPVGVDDHPTETRADRETEFAVERDGERRFFSARVSPLTDDDGDELGHGLLLYDITEQRRREEDLDLLRGILTRILRHNLRNDLTVVQASAQLLGEAAPERRDAADRIVERAERINEMSDKVRVIERLLEDDARFRVDLADTVDRAVDGVAADYPGATVESELPDSLAVLATRELDAAVRNLVENAVVHNDDPDPWARVEVDGGDGWAELRVEDDGPGIPEGELAAIHSEEVTPLEHVSGVGLWIVRWVVGKSGGDLAFERTDRGTRVTVRLERAQTPDSTTDGAGGSAATD